MQALLYDPGAPQKLRLGDVPDPVPAADQALVEVGAASMNFGELAFLDGRRAPGEVLGFDAAGVVVAAAADGSGHPEGTRVTTFGYGGGWARLRAVSTADLARLPEAADLGGAAAVPTAGVTALRAVRALGPVVGRRVLVTGASGGVGRFAVQLAARAGAHVVASVGSAERGEGLRELGADEVVVGLDDVSEPVSGALDNVGGAVLARAFELLEPGGVVQSIGMASLEPTTIDFEQARLRAPGTRIETFAVGNGFAEDLAYLLGLLDQGALDPQIGWRGPWARAPEGAAALLGRQVRGKAVLDVA